MCKVYAWKLDDDTVFPAVLVSLEETRLRHVFVCSQTCGKLGWVGLV